MCVIAYGRNVPKPPKLSRCLLTLGVCAFCASVLAQEPYDPAEFDRYLPERLRGGVQAKPKLVPAPLPISTFDRVSGNAKALALYNEGVTLALAAKGQLAIEKYGLAIEANPKLPEARYGIGVELARLRHLDQAKVHLEEACKLRPGYVEASRLLTRTNAAIAQRFEH